MADHPFDGGGTTTPASDPTAGLAALVSAGEQRFRELIDALPAAVYTTDALGRVTHFNPACVALSGRTPVIGSDSWCVSWKLYHADGRPMPHDECPMAVSLREGRPVRGVEAIAERPDGTRVWFEPYPMPLFDDEGRVVGGINMLVDVSAHRRVEQGLREHARTLEALQRVGGALNAEVDTRRIVQVVTDVGKELSGAQFGAFFFNAVDQHGETYLLYTISGAPREAFEKFGVPRKTPLFSPTFTGEGVVRSDDITRDPRYGRMGPHHGMPEGHLPVRSYLAVPVVARSGEVLGGLLFGHSDVGVFTERAERLVVGLAAQAAIAIESARLREATERRIRQQRDLIGAFSSLRLDAGVSAETVLQGITDHLRQVIPSHQARASLRTGAAGAREIQAWSLSEKYDEWPSDGDPAAGEPPPRASLAAPLIGPGGEAIGSIELSDKHQGDFTEEDEVTLLQCAQLASGILENFRLFARAQQEIAERRQAEGRLRESESHVHLTTTAARVGTWRWNVSTQQVVWSDVHKELWGYEPGPEPCTYEDWARLIVPDDLRAAEAAIQRCLGGEDDDYDIEYRIEIPGEADPRWIRSTGKAVFDDSGEAVAMLGISVDVTHRKVSDQALRESEERFRMLADHMAQLAWTCDELGNVTWYNRRWLEYTGLSFEEMKGWNWSRVQHPDHLERVVESVLQSNETGQPWEDTFPLLGKDGEYRWFLSRAVPIHDESGEIVRWFGTNTDITAQRDAEQRAEEASRAKDRFLAVLSHELRTPLTPALMSAAALQKREDVPPDVRESLATIHRNVELQGRLIDDLLDLSLITSGKLRLTSDALDVNDVIRRACDTCRADMREHGVHLYCDFEADPFEMTGDAARIQQVFWNLLNNAAKFTPRGGQVFVRTRNVDEGEGTERIRVTVRDTGIGIAPADLERVFNPFEQAEASGGVDLLMARQFGGMGLGLPICRSLVEQHGGVIHAESPGPGLGTTFVMELPAAVRATEGAAEPHASGPASAGLRSLRLLVVDDHADTADVLGQLLTLSGHDVRTAGSGQEALQLVDDHVFDVLVSDLGLPDMTGYELMRRIAEIRPIKGIAISGYGMEEDIERSREAGFGDHLVKPVTLPRVEQALRRLTSNPSGA